MCQLSNNAWYLIDISRLLALRYSSLKLFDISRLFVPTER